MGIYGNSILKEQELISLNEDNIIWNEKKKKYSIRVDTSDNRFVTCPYIKVFDGATIESAKAMTRIIICDGTAQVTTHKLTFNGRKFNNLNITTDFCNEMNNIMDLQTNHGITVWEEIVKIIVSKTSFDPNRLSVKPDFLDLMR